MRRILLFLLSFFAVDCARYDLVSKLENPGGARNTPGPVVTDGLYAYWNLNGDLADTWDNGTGLQNGTGSGVTFVADRYGRSGFAANLAPGGDILR